MYIIFKDKKSKRSHKAVGIKVFLPFLLGERRIQIRIRIRIHTSDCWIRIRIQEAQKHVDPDSDLDPQHWRRLFWSFGRATAVISWTLRSASCSTLVQRLPVL